jgi:4-aminobutyrate aminotransferase-like enzyme/Ser/Thr protein kinase RdoA (MazF antagonist)
VGSGEAGRCARDLYGIDAAPLALPGERDDNFRLDDASGRSYVLKFIDVGAQPSTVDCSVRVLQHLRREDPSLPVPEALPTLAGTPIGRFEVEGSLRNTLLIRYLPGQGLGSTACTAPLLADLGAVLARIDRALRGFFHPALEQSLAWDVRRLPELAAFIAELDSPSAQSLLRRIVGRFASRRGAFEGLRSQAIHGDGHAGNILVHPAAAKVAGIVDFGDMIRAPLILELAVAMSELLTEACAGPDDLAPLLQGYTAVQKLQAAEVAHLHDLILARHAVTVLIHAWRRRHDPEGAAGVADAAAQALRSAGQLLEFGEAACTRRWHDAAGTVPAPELRRRRQHLLGSGAELFYEEPLHLVRGEGAWLFDPAGRRYLDVYNNVPHVGHAHPVVVAAIAGQAALLATHTRYLHEAVLDYAEQLCSRLPPHLDTCIFVNSGSEANDVAWRIAKSLSGRDGGLVMEFAYHGITDAVSALTPQTGTRVPQVETLGLPADPFDPAGTQRDLERALRELAARGHGAAAFYLDSALTSNGIFDPPPSWLESIVARVRAGGGLFVGDEVQYGLGRSGSHFWGFERRGVTPDIVTMGKPMGNGYPMGALISSRAIIEEFQARTGFFSTFGGNPVAAAAGIAVLRVIEEERLMENAQRVGAYLRERLVTLAGRRECLVAVRGAGLMLALEMGAMHGRTPRQTARRAVNLLAGVHGVLTGTEGPAGNVLKLRPPLCFNREQADLLLTALDQTAAAIDGGPGP